MTTLSNSLDEAEEERYYSTMDTSFKELAPHYDLLASPFTKLRRKIVDMTGAPAGSKILDVATGTGEQALAFAQRGYQTVGVDLSDAMLKIASGKNRYAHATFEVADATRLRFEDSSFDVSTISFALHEMPLAIIEKVLKEMVRVTRPEGRVVIVDYGLPKNPVSRFMIYHLISLFEHEYYRSFVNMDLDPVLDRAGIRRQGQRMLLLGAARMVKGVKIQSPSP